MTDEVTEPKAPFADCRNCPCRDFAFVPPEIPKGKVRLAVVGEAPGWEEQKTGRPFVGNSGRLLNRTLQNAGVQREEVLWTNAVLCSAGKDDLPEARKCCEKRLREELKAKDVKTVLAVGAWGLHSAATLKRSPGILKFRGAVLEPSDPLRNHADPWNVVASVHPAFILRTPPSSPSWEHLFVNDVERAVKIADEGYVPPEKLPGKRLLVARDLETLRKELFALLETVVIDIETVEKSGKNLKKRPPNIHENRLTCLVIADVNTAVTIPISKTQSGEGRFWNGDHDEVISVINECLASRIAVTHNGPAYDHIGLARAGIILKRWEDSLNAYHVITSYFPKNLRHVVSCYVAAPPWKEWPHDVSLQDLWYYNGQDGLYNALAWQELRASMDEDDLRVYEHDKKNAEICTRMSRNGFQFDTERAKELVEKLILREQEVRAEVAQVVGRPNFNVLSTFQLAAFLFKECGVNVIEKTDGGEPSVAKGVLRQLAVQSDERVAKVALAAIEVRSLRKCRNTYITSKKWDPHSDGRVRATFQSWGTISGRWSAKDPNLANLPTGRADPSKKWGGIRSLYTAGPGRVLVYFDAKQMEFRVAAYASGDKNMIAVCEDPSGDVHFANAVLLFGDAFLNASPKEQKGLRDLAKRAVFAVNYFAEAETIYENLLAEGVLIKLSKVKAMCDKMQRQFPDYYKWQARNLDATIRQGWIADPILGRKRHLGHAPKPTDNANFPIQAGAAAVMNPKLQKIEALREESQLDALLCSMVYDSATWDTHPKDASQLITHIQDVWKEPVIINGNVAKFPVDIKTGLRWSDAA